MQEHQLPVQRACRVVRLSRAAFYRPPVPASRRDAAVIAALTAVVARYARWGFWKLFDRHARGGPAVEPQARASGVLRAAAESAAAHDPARAATGAATAGGAAGAESDLGARLHDRDALRRPARAPADDDRRRQSGRPGDRDGTVAAQSAGDSGARRARRRPRLPVGDPRR